MKYQANKSNETHHILYYTFTVTYYVAIYEYTKILFSIILYQCFEQIANDKVYFLGTVINWLSRLTQALLAALHNTDDIQTDLDI